MFKESVGDKILRRERKRGRDPEDGCEGSEGADGKKRAHQELSVRGRRSEREQRSEGLRESFVKQGEGGAFLLLEFSRPAQLQNSG